MPIRIKTIFRLLREAFQEWQQDKVSVLAAALAYYMVFSITPLLVIAIAIVGAVFGQSKAQNEILQQINNLVGSQGAGAIEIALRNASQPEISSIASIISVLVLFIGASGVFTQLQEALNTVWRVKPKPSSGLRGIIRKRLLSFCMVLVLGILLLLSLILSALLSAFSKLDIIFVSDFLPVWRLLNSAISFGLVTLLVALIYKYLPDVTIRWKDVWVGAIITALLFNVGKYVLGLYLGGSSFGSAYGAAGSLIVFLAWVFYSAQILLFGAELTQVYARKYGANINPNRHSERL
ncbi:MAG: hypothetical protein Tsb0014_07970 [Pleurocapsa sp.]